MRAPDLNDGTLKAVLILILLGANIALAVFLPKPPASQERTDFARTPPPALGSARASRAVFRALAENSSSPRTTFSEALGEAPRAAREARALPSHESSSKEIYVARP